MADGTELTAQKFNYYCYINFKAMCDIVVDNKLQFNRKKFENILGEKLLPFFAPMSTTQELLSTIPQEFSNDSKIKAIHVGLQVTDEVIKNLVALGFCAQAERNERPCPRGPSTQANESATWCGNQFHM